MFVGCCLTILAHLSSINGFCYEVQSSSAVSTQTNLQYGSGYTQAHPEGGDALFLDKYELSGDDRKDRPVFILFHGGGFMQSLHVTKESLGEINYCQTMARHGFVSVAPDYRQLKEVGYVLSTRFHTDYMIEAVWDALGAIRYVKHNSNAWGVASNRVILAGYSAGAQLALLTVYHPSHGSGAANTLTENTDLVAVVSMSGSLNGRADCIIDPRDGQPTSCGHAFVDVGVSNIGVLSTIPLAVIHGTSDTVIPYVDGQACYTAATDAHPTTSALMITIPHAGHVPILEFVNTENNYLGTLITWLVTAASLDNSCTPQGGKGGGKRHLLEGEVFV